MLAKVWHTSGGVVDVRLLAQVEGLGQQLN